MCIQIDEFQYNILGDRKRTIIDGIILNIIISYTVLRIGQNRTSIQIEIKNRINITINIVCNQKASQLTDKNMLYDSFTSMKEE